MTAISDVVSVSIESASLCTDVGKFGRWRSFFTLPGAVMEGFVTLFAEPWKARVACFEVDFLAAGPEEVRRVDLGGIVNVRYVDMAVYGCGL